MTERTLSKIKSIFLSIKSETKERTPYIKQYVICLLLHMVVPLLPLGFEYAETQNISDKSLAIAVAMYIISIGISSRDVLIFVIALGFALILSVAFGVLSMPPPLTGTPDLWRLYTKKSAIWMAGIMFVLHALERFNRHVREKSYLLEFMNPSSKCHNK